MTEEFVDIDDAIDPADKIADALRDMRFIEGEEFATWLQNYGQDSSIILKKLKDKVLIIKGNKRVYNPSFDVRENCSSLLSELKIALEDSGSKWSARIGQLSDKFDMRIQAFTSSWDQKVTKSWSQLLTELTDHVKALHQLYDSLEETISSIDQEFAKQQISILRTNIGLQRLTGKTVNIPDSNWRELGYVHIKSEFDRANQDLDEKINLEFTDKEWTKEYKRIFEQRADIDEILLKLDPKLRLYLDAKKNIVVVKTSLSEEIMQELIEISNTVETNQEESE